MFVFIYNGQRAEAMRGYNDDLVMSYAVALWVRETALRLRAEGVQLQRKALDSMNQYNSQGVYTNKTDKADSWKWEVGKNKESLEWLL